MKVDFVLALALLVADVDSRDNFANGDEFIVDATLFELVGGGSVELHCSAKGFDFWGTLVDLKGNVGLVKEHAKC